MSDRDDVRHDVRDFLVSRRAKITPDQVGLPPGTNRRVAGLRRVEVAMLAGVSVEYYARLERGHVAGASESVLESIAGALRLDDAERAHLLGLVRAAGGSPRRRAGSARAPLRPEVRPGVQRLLDAMTGAAAVVTTGRLDVLAANALGRAVFAPALTMPAAPDAPDAPPNNARFTFLDPRATTFFRDWDKAAADVVALLRAEAGRHPLDRGLSDLIGELSTRSDAFRTRWAAHDVLIHASGSKRMRHPVVGDLDLAFESLPLPGDDGQTVVAYTAAPGSASADALAVLASWSATDAAQERCSDSASASTRTPAGNADGSGPE